MSDPTEPRRWADDPDAPRALAEAIRAARAAGPTPAQVDAVARAAPRPPAAPPRLGLLRFGPVVGVAAVVAALGLTRAALPSAPRPRPPAQARVEAPVRASPSPAAPPASAAPPAVTPEPAPPPAPAPSRPRAPAPCRDGELTARVTTATRALLAGEHRRALALADADAARCPAARSAEDRERVAVEALTRLGRVAEARAQLRRFEGAFPSSLYLRRLRAMVGSAPR